MPGPGQWVPSGTALGTSVGVLAASQDLGPRFREALEMLVEAHKGDLQQAAALAATGQAGSAFREASSEVVHAMPRPGNTSLLGRGEVDVKNDSNVAKPKDSAGSEAIEGSEGSEALDTVEEIKDTSVSAKNLRLSLNSNIMAGQVHGSNPHHALVPLDLGPTTPVDEPEYDVSMYYHTEGAAQAIATSNSFGYLTLSVIAANAVYMGFDADYNDADSLNTAHWSFILFENLFCIFFFFEWCVRFCAFNGKCNCFKDGWFKFDSFLLIIIIFETWVMLLILELMTDSSFTFDSGPLRLLRLLRLARLVRIMRAFPELLCMIQGMMVAMRAVASAMILLVMALYAWGIAMNSFLKDDEALYVYWGTVTRSMMTLFANGALGDSIGDVLRDMQSNYPALLAMLAFIGFASLTVLNMLIGILCEVVTAVSQAEKEEATLWKLKSTVLVMLKRIDENQGGTICKEELAGLLRDEEALAVMSDLDIDVHHFLEMTEMFFEEAEELSIPWIMQLLVDNQGGRPTTVADLCHYNAFQGWARKKQMASIENGISALRDLLEVKLLKEANLPK